MTLTITNLSLEINKKTLIKNFNLILQRGEIWCVLGKNGVGKTCFLHSLCNIRKLSEGFILFNNLDISKMHIKERAKTIGLLQQEQDYIFPASVREIVSAGRHPHDVRIIGETKNDFEIVSTILKQLDLTTLSEKNITELSGGEKRRATIGALLAQTPEIYLLDEPSNHLDIHYQIKILDLFKHMAHEESKIIVMVTHDLNLAAKYADNIILFFDDESIMSGHKKDLLKTEYLSQLYHHPIQHFSNDSQDYFFV